MVIVRIAVAILGAIIASFVLLIAVEIFSSVVHPFPADFQGTHDEICAHVAKYPDWVLAAVVPMWGLIAMVGTWIAGRWGGGGSAIFLGLLVMVAVICNVTTLPYVTWFKVVQPIVVLIGVGLGYRFSRRAMATDVSSRN